MMPIQSYHRVAKIPIVIFRGLSLLCLETFDLFLNVSNPPGLLINRLKKFCIRFRFCRDITVEYKVLNFYFAVWITPGSQIVDLVNPEPQFLL